MVSFSPQIKNNFPKNFKIAVQVEKMNTDKSNIVKLIKILISSIPASTPSSNGGDDIPQVAAEVDHEADPDHSIQDQGNFQS